MQGSNRIETGEFGMDILLARSFRNSSRNLFHARGPRGKRILIIAMRSNKNYPIGRHKLLIRKIERKVILVLFLIFRP